MHGNILHVAKWRGEVGNTRWMGAIYVLLKDDFHSHVLVYLCTSVMEYSCKNTTEVFLMHIKSRCVVGT